MKQTIEAHPNSLTDLSALTGSGQIGARHEPHDSSRRAARAFVRALDQACLELPDDVERRLAFARQMALQHVRIGVTQSVDGRGVASWGHGAPTKLGFLRGWTHILPALALLLGLLTTSHLMERRNVAAAAEIDTALLNDELPPEAYADSGFVEFLKRGQGADLELIASDRQPEAAPAE
jgi:Protein of unknown function (DUF3619)